MSDFMTEFSKFKTSAQIIRDALTTELNSILEELTAEQQTTFVKLFPEGVEKLKNDKLIAAVDLVHRTLAKNRSSR